MTNEKATMTIKFDVPANWHTAEECREMAESWENDELNQCMSTLMAEIWKIARVGGIEISYYIRTGRPKHFYETLKWRFEMLGFDVEAPRSPEVNSSSWVFKW